MTFLLILNHAPYGSELTYNALRFAMSLQRDHADVAIRMFLMAGGYSRAAQPIDPAGLLQCREDAEGRDCQRRTGQGLRHLLGRSRD